ncbi:hypothetical protein Lal_00027148 [Lupinus albus]|nr:hypothetical protein Lal_00027148 [Lupinus albus]
MVSNYTSSNSFHLEPFRGRHWKRSCRRLNWGRRSGSRRFDAVRTLVLVASSILKGIKVHVISKGTVLIQADETPKLEEAKYILTSRQTSTHAKVKQMISRSRGRVSVALSDLDVMVMVT